MTKFDVYGKAVKNPSSVFNNIFNGKRVTKEEVVPLFLPVVISSLCSLVFPSFRQKVPAKKGSPDYEIIKNLRGTMAVMMKTPENQIDVSQMRKRFGHSKFIRALICAARNPDGTKVLAVRKIPIVTVTGQKPAPIDTGYHGNIAFSSAKLENKIGTLEEDLKNLKSDHALLDRLCTEFEESHRMLFRMGLNLYALLNQQLVDAGEKNGYKQVDQVSFVLHKGELHIFLLTIFLFATTFSLRQSRFTT